MLKLTLKISSNYKLVDISRKKVLKNFKKSFKKVSKKFQKSFKKVSKMFQKSFVKNGPRLPCDLHKIGANIYSKLVFAPFLF